MRRDKEMKVNGEPCGQGGRNTLDCDLPSEMVKKTKKCGISRYGIKIGRDARD